MTIFSEIVAEAPSSDLVSILDQCYSALSRIPSLQAVEECICGLAELYDEAAADERLGSFREQCQSHSLHKLVLEDPYSRRAFEKPRGYAGDAVMLDYIYRPKKLDLSDAGRVIHDVTTSLSPALSILWRRDHIASEIKKTIDRGPSPNILSVASGHLRELDIVQKLTGTRNAVIVALDQDEASLEEAIASYPDFNIRPANQSISYLIKGLTSDHEFDLIYSAGLFDYLPEKTAIVLVQKLVKMLRPDGRLIVGNFTPENYGRGFMEGMMNWKLIYRNEDDLIKLIESAGPKKEYHTYRDDPGNVAYIEVSQHWN